MAKKQAYMTAKGMTESKIMVFTIRTSGPSVCENLKESCMKRIHPRALDNPSITRCSSRE